MASLRDFLVVGGGRIVTAMLALLGLKIATMFLTPVRYGELALLIAFQTLFGLFLISPVLQYVNRHTYEWWTDGVLLSKFADFHRFVAAVSAIGAFTIVVIAGKNSLSELIWAILAMLLMIYAAACNAAYLTTLNLLGCREESVVWGIVTVIAGLSMAVWFVSLSATATAWFAGQALGMGVGAIGAWRALLRHAMSTHVREPTQALLNKKIVLSYCLPLAIATGFMWLQVSGYRFVVMAYWGLEALGFLALGLLLASQIFAMAESLAQQFFYPLFYRRIHAADVFVSNLAFSDLINVMGPLYLVLAGMTVVGAPYILLVLASPQYADAEVFVRLGAAIECCRVLGNMLGIAAQVTKRTDSIALPYSLGAIVLFGMLLFAGRYHLLVVWIGVFLVVAALVTLAAMSVFMYRQVQFSLDRWRWLSGSLALACLATAALWAGPPSSVFGAGYALILIALAGGVFTAGLLWRNAALQRMLAVNLRVGPTA